MTKEEILSLLAKKRAYIKKEFEVEKIGLFGSYAKDLQNEQSDIDIYVEFRHKTFDNLTGLWTYLEELYHKKVDLFYKHKENNPIIISNILKDVIYG